MEIFINHAILHVLDNDGGESRFSNEELDIDSDVCSDFIIKHVKKLMNNPAVKEATFDPESPVHQDIQKFVNGEIYFKDASLTICQRLNEIMAANVEIPSGDVLVAQFEAGNDAYLAILKLNYKECYAHESGDGENGTDNQIVKYRHVLPFDNGKVEEACLIPYHPMVIRLLEKPYMVNGEPRNYFSELFLCCSPELSKKETAQIINEITEEITEKYFQGSVETAAKIKVALMEEAIEEEGAISIASVASRVFTEPEQEEARQEYINLAKEAGIRPEVDFGEKFTKQQFSAHRFKADNGIEVKFPAELSDDSNIIEFQNHEDGSVTIILKNMRRG